MRAKAATKFNGVKVFVALLIVLVELIFINSLLASAGIEFVLSSAAVTVALPHATAVQRCGFD